MTEATDVAPTRDRSDRWRAVEAEIRSHLPGLFYQRDRLHRAGVAPTGVMLPARLNVPYDGDDATDVEASCMGLPVTWVDGERWGLVVDLPGAQP